MRSDHDTCYYHDAEYIDRFISWYEGDVILDEGLGGFHPETFVVDVSSDITTQHHKSLSWVCRQVQR